MTKLFNTISSTAEERIKNPFTGAFLASWAVFNWKPIFFFILSTKNIEAKISYILLYYSDILNIIIYPLLSAAFFLFLVPWINLANDKFIKKSKDTRDSDLHSDKILKIQRETKEEEEKAKREIAIADVREKEGKNQQLEDLRKSIEILDKDLTSERSKNLELLQLNSQESEKWSLNIKNLHDSNKKMENKLLEELKKRDEDLNHKHEEIYLLDKGIVDAKQQLENERELNRNCSEDQSRLLQKNENLEQVIFKLQNELENLRNNLKEKDFVISRMKDPKTKVIEIGFKKLLEYFTVNSDIKYFDYENMKIIAYDEILILSGDGRRILDITNDRILNRAMDQYEIYLKNL